MLAAKALAATLFGLALGALAASPSVAQSALADLGDPATAGAGSGVALGASSATARDPALGDLQIDVASNDRRHRAPQVGRAANSALGSLTFPRPVAFFAPPAQSVRTFVGVDTWFWVAPHTYRPIVRIVAVKAVVVTLTATPVALQFIPGDGTPMKTCPGPGTPWLAPRTRSLCSHRYQRASTASALGRIGGRYQGSVQTVWRIHWQSNTGLSGTVGPIVVPTPVSLRVVEAQAVLGR